MIAFFITVLNMSLTASFAVLIVIAIRFVLRRFPKRYSYALWLVVLFRFLCPVSFSSILSPLPAAAPIPHDIMLRTAAAPPTGLPGMDSAVNQAVTSNQAAQAASINPSQVFLSIAACVWIAEIVILLGYAAISYSRLMRGLATATKAEGQTYESDFINTAFVLGFIRPRIYIPLGLSGDTLDYVLQHERTHLRRRDYLIKPLAYLALCLHWFNPLAWLSYLLACRDMELSCDEAVLRRMGPASRAAYSQALLTLSTSHGSLTSPLAFGESNVKMRIQNALRWQAPRVRTAVAGVFLCIVTLIVCAANPVGEIPQPASVTPDTVIGACPPSIVYANQDYAILHSYFGLFIYDLQKESIAQSVDLAPIECNITDGEDACEIAVSPNGKTVYLHPMTQTTMYVLKLPSGRLTQKAAPLSGGVPSLAGLPDHAPYRSEPDIYENDGLRFVLTAEETAGSVQLTVTDSAQNTHVYAPFRDRVENAPITGAEPAGYPQLNVLADNIPLFVLATDGNEENGWQTIRALHQLDFYSDIPYVPLGAILQTSLQPGADAPYHITVYDAILAHDGTVKYRNGQGHPAIDAIWEKAAEGDNGIAAPELTVEQNIFASLSSNGSDYDSGNTLRGFKVLCTWADGRMAAYWFVLRTDAW